MNQTTKEVYTRIVQLLTEDGSIHDAIEDCLESPWSYFEENIDRYDERGIDEDETEETIIWLGIADELIDANEAVELDWNPELEDFTYFMKSLSDKKNLKIEDTGLMKRTLLRIGALFSIGNGKQKVSV